MSKTNDRSVSAEITVYTNMTDNGAIYKCEASNPATEVPFIETIKLNVYCERFFFLEMAIYKIQREPSRS